METSKILESCVILWELCKTILMFHSIYYMTGQSNYNERLQFLIIVSIKRYFKHW